MSDLISREDAIEAVCGVVIDEFDVSPTRGYEVAEKALSALPSAEAEPSLKAIKRQIDEHWYLDPPSAEAVQGWIPFTRRPMTEEEQEDYPNCTFIFDCGLPDDGDEILVSNRRFVWMDVFCSDIDGCYLDSGDDIDEDMAWMPLPTPYKGGDK